MLRIGLLGFTLENANKGCEALTYSFLNIIKRICGENFSVRYYSTVELYGKMKKYFPTTDITYYQLSRKHILTELLSDINRNCDVIFDISFGDGFADIYNPKSAFWNSLVKIIAGKSKVPFVLLPQTYGPFSSSLLEREAAIAIKNATYVFSRDKISTEYVSKIAKVTPVTVTDLAFSLPYQAYHLNTGKIKLGINVSGLLWKGGFYKDNQFGLTVDYPKYICSVIEHYMADERYEMHLVPHVIENVSKSNDGDLFANAILKEKYPEVICAPAFEDPIETKNYIASLDVLTAARMHATVDAFSSFVPVIPFAYSRKFEGLYGALGYKYIVDGRVCSTEEAINKTIAWIDSYPELKVNVETGMRIVDARTKQFEDFLQNLVSKCVE